MPGRGKQARGKELPGRVRQAFEDAIEKLKENGVITDMSDVWQEMIAQDPFKAFQTLAHYIPKELLIEQEVTHRLVIGEAMSVDEWEKIAINGAKALEERAH